MEKLTARPANTGRCLEFGIPVVTVGVAISLFLVGVRQGFDFTDEGFYYLAFAHPEHVSDNQTSFHFFGAVLYQLLGENIVAMRIATMVAMLGASAVFMQGWSRCISSARPALGLRFRSPEMVAAVMASLMGFATSPVAPSYNFQNAACLLAACGLLLTACSIIRETDQITRTAGAYLIGFAALTGFDFFVKFSTSVPLAAAGMLFFFFSSDVPLRTRIRFAAVIAACLCVIAISYFTLVQSPARWWFGIKGTAMGIFQGGYGIREIQRYTDEMISILPMALGRLAPTLGVMALIVGFARIVRSWPRTSKVLFRSGPAVTVALHAALTAYKEPTLYLLGTGVLIGAWILIDHWTSPRHLHPNELPDDGKQLLAGACILAVVAPYIGAFGTTNQLHTNIWYQIAPWFVLILLGLARLDHSRGHRWSYRLGLLALMAISLNQFYRNHWRDPYRVAGGRSAQTVPTQIGRTTLLLSPEANAFIHKSRAALTMHGYSPGDDLLAFFNMPGFVYAMDGQSPGHPWYFSGDLRSFDLNLMRLKFIDSDRRRKAFIVRNGDWDDFLPYLSQADLDFPGTYKKITSDMQSPFTRETFEIWAPKDRIAR